jgi:thiol-disulfide isomerase/thioredoxin
MADSTPTSEINKNASRTTSTAIWAVILIAVLILTFWYITPQDSGVKRYVRETVVRFRGGKVVDVRASELVQTLDRGDRSGRRRVVFVHADWCGHCQSTRPVVAKVAKAVHDRAVVYSVNCSDTNNKDVLRLLRGEMLRMAQDKKQGAGIPGFPGFFILDENAHVVKILVGAREPKDLKEAFTKKHDPTTKHDPTKHDPTTKHDQKKTDQKKKKAVVSPKKAKHITT